MKTPALTTAPVLRLWLPYFVMSVALTTLVYVAVQQSYRQSANDPQLQMAQEAAGQLEHGVAPSQIVASLPQVIANVSPAVTIFDASHKPVASSTSRGSDIVPPSGTFDHAMTNNQDIFTWQPKPGIRQAAVLVYEPTSTGSYYVLADRSLAATEARESQLTQMVGATLAAVLLAGLVLLLIIK